MAGLHCNLDSYDKSREVQPLTQMEFSFENLKKAATTPNEAEACHFPILLISEISVSTKYTEL